MTTQTQTETDGEAPLATDRRGDWIQVRSGGKFYPLDARPEDVRLTDIAHALSHLCRYTGHTPELYTVAEHSVRCSRAARPDAALAALLHDAAEAYIGDISRPLKRSLWADVKTGVEPVNMLDLKRAKHAEADLLRVIFAGLGVPWPSPEVWAEVDRVDLLLLATEARDLMAPLHPDWRHREGNGYATLPEKIVPWSPRAAKYQFLKRALGLLPAVTESLVEECRRAMGPGPIPPANEQTET